MTRELENGELAELFALSIRHECSNELIERHVVGGKSACCVLLQVGEIVLHGKREERKAVVEEWCKRHRLVALVVEDQPEVAEVTIRIADEGVKDNHVAERLVEPFPHGLELGGNLRELVSGE